MADDADMRAVLREHGHEPSTRGRLAPKWVAEYERITAGNGSQDPGADDDWDGPDDSADLIDMEPVTAIIPGTEPDDMPPPEAERRPRRVSTRKPSPGGSFIDRLARKKTSSGGKAKPKRKPRPRVPVDRFIGRFWEYAGQIIAPVSQPAARAFILEAPIAGLLFEDIVRDTVVDRVLQPAVRAEEKAEKAVALTPPLIVLAIERAQGMEEPRRQLQLAVLSGMLREALRMQVRYAGQRMMELQARMEASEAEDAQINAIIAQIFPQATVEQPEPGPEFDFGMAGAGERTG